MGDKKVDASGAVIQRVIREVGGGNSYPVLTKTNYSDWALIMKVKLRARALWNAIEKGTTDEQEDMMALDALVSAVPPEMVSTIGSKETAKAAWDAIATMRIGDDRVKKATAQQLRRKFDLATFSDGETVEEFALRLNGMAAHLTTLGDEVKDKDIVAKMLRSLPPRFKQIAIAIKTLLDPSTMTVADLTGRLQEAEEELEGPQASIQHEGKLYLTEEEWEAQRKKREVENHFRSGSRGGGGESRGGGRRGRGPVGWSSSGSAKKKGDECRRCGKLGHWARECRSRPKKEQAHAVQDEEDASLCLAKCSSILSPPTPQSAGTSGQVSPIAQIEIHEEKVFAQLGEEEERDADTWVLDTGATNHMSGSRAAFSKLDATVHGTVRFGDDSKARIEGRGTVVFMCKDEGAQWDWGTVAVDGGPNRDDDVFTVEYSILNQGPPERTEETSGTVTPEGELTPPASPQGTGGDTVPAGSGGAEEIEFASPPNNVSEHLDADHDDNAPLRFRRIDDIIGPASPRGFVPRTLVAEELHAVSSDEPASFAEAERSPSWRKAMKEEMDSIEDNRTWSLADLPSGRRAIGLKWVFKVKRDEHGAVTKHKARLVAKGYVQRHGIDYDEVFAPVARLDSVRLIIALAAHEGWEVHHMDVKSAFLNGDLEEEVYVGQPPGFVIPGKEHKVLKLRKALYGLHQAPRAWNAKLDSTLLSFGFRKSPSEHAVYIRQNDSKQLVIGVYVDDLVITGSNGGDIKSFKEEMAVAFKMSDLGLLRYYLGIEVKQSARGISLSQGAYAGKILEKSDMAGCNPCHVPMEPRLKLSKHSPEPPVDATAYRSIVGSLRYLVNTRPDLAFAVGYVSRFLEDPREDHFGAVKRILRYVAGTQDWGLWFGRREKEEPYLTGFSDSDYGGDVDTSKSTTGVIFFLSGSPITWQSMKQKVVAQSSCEAEYIAAANAACQALWLARVLSEVQGTTARAPMLRVDNKSSISLIKNPVLHGQSKHIRVKYHFVREAAEEGLIDVEFIRSEDQLGDILTKPLGRTKFHELRGKIGLIDINDGHKA